ncbi:histidine phosphatase family protein [Candidatus Pacearchaeota archaeon]|nr:histidine phosphatase family protein [Candidatus Pacearchaeota archaeon]
MDITFIRHAEKELGEGDLSLSENGKKQAKNLAKRLKGEHFDEFYCSELLRSRETSQLVSETINLDPIIVPSLNEFEPSLLKIDQEIWGEKETKQYQALCSFLANFNKRGDEKKRVLIIAHGNTNRLILTILLELNLKNIIRFRLLETGISEVYWMPKFKNWRMKYWNDVSHQPKELVEGINKY